MSLKRKVLAATGTLLVAAVIFTGTAYAASTKGGDTPTVTKGETVDGTLYIAGETVTIAGSVKGDVFCAGQTVEITGTVEGDVLCVAQTLRIDGQVDGDVRVAGQTIELAGDVAGSATVFGQTFELGKDATIGRDVTTYGQTIDMQGTVARDIMAGAQIARFNGKVGRDVALESDTTRIESGARVSGDFIYTSSKDAKVSEDAVLSGQTERNEPPQQEQKSGSELFLRQLAAAAYFFVGMMIVGLAIRWVAPKSYGAVRSHLVVSPLGALLNGAGLLILPPFAALALLITGVGAPLAGLIMVVWLALLSISFVFGGYGFGRFVLSHTKEPSKLVIVTSLAVGLGLVSLTMVLPFIGIVVCSVVTIWGLGGVWRALMAARAASLGKKH